MAQMLIGAIALAALLVGLFFLLFAIAFWLEGGHRLFVYQWAGTDEASPLYYLVRLLAYGLIIAAIVDKNRKR